MSASRLSGAFAVFIDTDSTRAERDALIEGLSRAERQELARMLVAKENRIRLSHESLLAPPHMPDDPKIELTDSEISEYQSRADAIAFTERIEAACRYEELAYATLKSAMDAQFHAEF